MTEVLLPMGPLALAESLGRPTITDDAPSANETPVVEENLSVPSCLQPVKGRLVLVEVLGPLLPYSSLFLFWRSSSQSPS